MKNMMDPMQLMQNMGLNKKQKKIMEQMDPKFSHKKTSNKIKKGKSLRLRDSKNSSKLP